MRRRTVFARALSFLSVAPLFAGSKSVAIAREDSPAEANEALIRRIIEEAFNVGNLDVVDEGFAGDYVDHQAAPEAEGGPTAFKAFVRAFRATFPDAEVTVEDLVAEGDRVALRVTLRGSQQGPLGEIPATGVRVEFGGYHIYRLADGKVTEHWGLQDDLGLLLQLGVIAPQAIPSTPGALARA